MLERLTHATFAGHVGDRFQLRADATTVLDVELIRATLLGPETADPARPNHRAPFSLWFRGPKQPWVPQRIYTLEHARLGSLDIFLVPIGPDPGGMLYEAIFT